MSTSSSGLFLLLFALSSSSVWAQRPASFGLAAGAGPSFVRCRPGYLDLGRDTDQHIDQYLRATSEGASAAQVAAYVRVQPWRNTFFQPEVSYLEYSSGRLLYARRTGTGILSAGPTGNTQLYQQSLSLALLGGGYLDSPQQAYWLAGPAIAARLTSHSVWNISNSSSTVARALDESGAKSQFFMHAGLGLRFGRIDLETRYAYGLTPLVRTLRYQNKDYDFRVTSHLLVFKVGVHFPKHQH
jgi:hypothetical protein